LTEEKSSMINRLIQAFWDFIDREDQASKFLVLVSFVCLFHISLFIAGGTAFFPSKFAQTYLSSYVYTFISTAKFYIILWAILITSGIILKRLNKDITVLIYIFVFAYCFSHLQQSRYTGFHTILTPLLIIFDITVIVLFLGEKFGIIALIFFSVLFPLEILFEQLEILKLPSSVLETTKFNDIFRSSTYIVVFTSFLFLTALTSGLVLIHFMRVINRNTEELRRQNLVIQRLSAKLSLYLPKILVRLLERGEKDIDKQYQRVRVTIFISEIKDFTQISEVLQPEDTSKILNIYLTKMSKIVEEHGGIVDKFFGDSIIVYFGGIEDEKHQHNALQAIRTALIMQKQAKLIQEHIHRDGLEIPFKIRLGLSTGYVTIGSFGSEERKDYTIIGREVNITSFIKDVCEPGGICVSYNTYLLTKDQFEYEDASILSIEGLHTPLKVYKLIKEKEEQKQI